ncbi:sensor histidine kinase [Aliikangiella sp. IMCC44359]|uniref:sensor histidine kinase n=1 Tax=Aliikangiella sp. IMCC44359 TaxID=3459125 RepID=UPI00403AF874
MNPSRISILSVIIIGALFTYLLVTIHSLQPLTPEKDFLKAQENKRLIENKIANHLNTLNISLESLSYNHFWQSAPASEWSFWLESQRPLYRAAGISLLGVHSVSTDVVYFEKPSLRGQYAELKKPLQQLYKIKSTVNVLQVFRGELATISLIPIKNAESEIIGTLVGISYLNTSALKQFERLVSVPIAIINNNRAIAISIETSPALSDYRLVEVNWPDAIKSSLWKMVLLVEPEANISGSLLYILIGCIFTFILVFIIWKQLEKLNKSTKLLNDTIDIQLPVTEQLSRLATLQNLSHSQEIIEISQSIRIRLEQLMKEKKALSLDIKKLQENERRLKNKVTSLKSERDSAFAAPKLKSEFLSRMGDEITTPMKSVVSMLKLLSEYQFEAEPKQLLNIAKRSTRTLVDNLNNILDFSKLDAGMLKLSKTTFSVRELVDQLSSELSHYANDKGLSLQASTDPEVPNEVTADLFRVKQILRNLLGNAIRFTKVGEVSLYADIVNNEMGKMLRFTVKDTGVGIPQEAQKDLFASLEQTTKLTNSSFAGRLRLIVSHQLTELMGGEIDVISESGKGSQFWFTIAL